jgi:hypothetical protein
VAELKETDPFREFADLWKIKPQNNDYQEDDDVQH